MNTDHGIGKIIPDEVTPQKDAIHVPIKPITAPCTLFPCQRVDGQGRPALGSAAVAIVDPFLSNPVMKDQRCWIFICPGIQVSLKHNWSHPEFDEEEESDSLEEMQEKINELEAERDGLKEERDVLKAQVSSEDYRAYQDDGCRGCYS